MNLVIDKQLSALVRFMAALTVAIHHYSQYVCANHLSENIIYKILSALGGYIAVGIFFFLSGYGLMESEKRQHLSMFAFFKKRFLRIYLPVLLVTALWLPIRSYVHGEQLLTGGVIYQFLWGFEDGVLWFVKVLLFLYLCFGIYIWIRAKYGQEFSFFCLNLLTICVIAVLSIIIKLPNFCLISIPLFTIGIMGSLFNKGYLYKVLIGLISWGIVICLFIVEDGRLAVYALINYVLIFIAILLLAKFPIKKKLAIPAVLGDISFDIYLVHNKVLMALRVLLPIVPLFYFVGLMTVFSALFYLLRKKLSI